MAEFNQIYSFRIIDLETGIIIFKRVYNRDEPEEIYSQSFISTAISFSHDNISQERVNTLIIRNLKVFIETTEKLSFVAAVSANYDTNDLKRILSHVRATFLRKYPFKTCDWQYLERLEYFKEFGEIIDEIVRHFSDTKLVLKIVLMGLDYAGKTTLTHAYAETNYDSYLPTTGLDILRINYQNKHIRLWDLGGQIQFRKLWPKFANEASGIIFVVDSATKRWKETKEVFELCKIFHLPYIVFANKQDLLDRAASIEFIARQLKIPKGKIIRGSALLSKGVFEALDHLLDELESE